MKRKREREGKENKKEEIRRQNRSKEIIIMSVKKYCIQTDMHKEEKRKREGKREMTKIGKTETKRTIV